MNQAMTAPEVPPIAPPLPARDDLPPTPSTSVSDPASGPPAPAGVPARWRSPTAVAWLFLAAAIAHPPSGMGVPICPSRLVTGVPCPGCGLTRSVSCAIRGDLASSWHYHPFGAGFLACALLVAAVGLLPRSARHRVRLWTARYRSWLWTLGFVYLVALLVYGFARMAGMVGGTV